MFSYPWNPEFILVTCYQVCWQQVKFLNTTVILDICSQAAAINVCIAIHYSCTQAHSYNACTLGMYSIEVCSKKLHFSQDLQKNASKVRTSPDISKILILALFMIIIATIMCATIVSSSLSKTIIIILIILCNYCVIYLTPYSPTYIPPFTLSGEYYSIFTTYIHYLYSPLIHHGYRSGLSIVYMNWRAGSPTCVGLLVDVHVTLWRMSMEPGVAVDAGYWVLFWSWLQSWMVAVNMETYKYNSTFSISEYWRIFTGYTNLGFASVCILVNIRQYSLRLQVLLYTYGKPAALSLEQYEECGSELYNEFSA